MILSIDEFSIFKSKCKSKIQEFYKVEWLRNVNESSKCYLYKGYKSELIMEKYLIYLPKELRIPMTKFRMCNHKLPIEIGRHNIKIERNLRICAKCFNDLGDEYHCMFICEYFKREKDKFIPKSCSRKPRVLKFCNLMSTNSNKTSVKIAKISKIIIKGFG